MLSKYKKQYLTIQTNQQIWDLLRELKEQTHLRLTDIISLSIQHFKDTNISEQDMIIFVEIYPVSKIDLKHETFISVHSHSLLKKLKSKYKIKLFLYQLLWIILLCYKYRKELFTTELSEQALNHYNNMKKFMNTVNNFTEEGHKNEIK